MKRYTKQKRAEIVNQALYYIYKNIASSLTIIEIAEVCRISPHHFHRIFKEETGKNLHETILSIRLQKAANLLLTNRYANIGEIAQTCGYATHTAFIKAFKGRFCCTPSVWIKEGHKEYAKKIIEGSKTATASSRRFEGAKPDIVKSKQYNVAYIRHTGYNISIKDSWQRLKAWAMERGIFDGAVQIGLHHDNPIITPLEECSYVACLEVAKETKSSGSVFTMEIPSALCARFSIEGRYGDVLRLMEYIYNVWFPDSGYEAGTIPSFALYTKNHFLEKNGEFALDFFVPIKVV